MVLCESRSINATRSFPTKHKALSFVQALEFRRRLWNAHSFLVDLLMIIINWSCELRPEILCHLPSHLTWWCACATTKVCTYVLIVLVALQSLDGEPNVLESRLSYFTGCFYEGVRQPLQVIGVNFQLSVHLSALQLTSMRTIVLIFILCDVSTRAIYMFMFIHHENDYSHAIFLFMHYTAHSYAEMQTPN